MRRLTRILIAVSLAALAAAGAPVPALADSYIFRARAMAVPPVPEAPFTFGAVAGAEPGATERSETVPLRGFRGKSASLSGVAGSAFQICADAGCSDGAPWISGTGSPLPATAHARVRIPAGDFGESRSATLSVGGMAGSFTVTSRAADTMPEPFSLGSPISSAEPGSQNLSAVATLEGFDRAPASLAGGPAELSVNGGPFGATPATLSAGDTARVRMAAAAFGETRTATLSVGGASATWSVTSRGRDTTPAAFSFTSVTGAQPGSLAASQARELRDHEGLTLSVSGGDYQTCTDAACSSQSAWTNAPRAGVATGTFVRVRAAAPAFGQTATATLTAGTVQATFAVTARGPNACYAPWGQYVAHGSSVTAWNAATSYSCGAETRTCNDGSLSGSYGNQSCQAPRNVTVTCTSTAGLSRSITAWDAGQNPLTGRAPSNLGTWVVYREGPHLNCDDGNNPSNQEIQDGYHQYLCRANNPYSVAGTGTYLRNCTWN